MKGDHFHPYFDSNRRINNFFTYLGILTTFGVVFPPLALALAVTVLVSAYWEKVKLGRLLSQAEELRTPSYTDVIEAECRGVESGEVLQMAAWTILTVTCWFYTLFLYDTLGDDIEFDGANWVLIVMPLLPGVAYAAYRVYMWAVEARSAGRTNSVDSVGSTSSGLGAITMSPLVRAAVVAETELKPLETDSWTQSAEDSEDSQL